jgi:hypothetical protein
MKITLEYQTRGPNVHDLVAEVQGYEIEASPELRDIFDYLVKNYKLVLATITSNSLLERTDITAVGHFIAMDDVTVKKEAEYLTGLTEYVEPQKLYDILTRAAIPPD